MCCCRLKENGSWCQPQMPESLATGHCPAQLCRLGLVFSCQSEGLMVSPLLGSRWG